MSCVIPFVAAAATSLCFLQEALATHYSCRDDDCRLNVESCCPEEVQEVGFLQSSLSIKQDAVDIDDSFLEQIPLSAREWKRTTENNPSRPAMIWAEMAQKTYMEDATDTTGGRHQNMPGSLVEVILQASHRDATGNDSSNQTDSATDTSKTDVDSITGATKNAEGDFSALGVTAALYFGASLACMLWLSCLRHRVPMVYEHRGTDGIHVGRHAVHARIPGEVSPPVSEGFFSWIWDSIAIGPEECTFYSGVDQGQLLELIQVAMQIILGAGIPLCIVSIPCYWVAGNVGLGILDHMEYMNANPGSWASWIAVGGVWYVVLVVQWTVFHAMERFHPIRVNWLKAMSAPRSTTVLVDEIPPERNSIYGLTSFFNTEVFHRPVVKSVYITKDCKAMQPLIKKHAQLHFDWQAADHAGRMEEADKLKAQEAEVDREMAKMRNIILSSDELNCETAFVEFFDRKDAHMAEKLFNPDHDEEIIVTVPPDPVDVIWSDLQVNKKAQHVRDFVGWVLLAVLLVFIVNVVLWMSRILEWDKLQNVFPQMDSLAASYPSLPSVWNGLANVLGLNLVLSFLPTILMWIFYTFWTVQAHAWSQVMLQHWYFYFLIVSTLLAQSLGDNTVQIIEDFFEHPYSAIDLLAQTVPSYSHFFISYMCVQWFSHALNVTRYLPLIKYGVYRSFYSEKVAHGLSEPEDQDYYGIGSRYSRFTFQLVIWLCFSVMSPIILLPAFVNFALCRICYGYLLVFAETRKPDLGGVFFVGAMKQLQQGLALMVVGMAGLLALNNSSKFPAYMAASALIFIGYTYYHFCHDIRWELLDFNDFLDQKGFGTRPATKSAYCQPELEDHSPKKDDEYDIVGAASLRMQQSLAAAWQFASCNAPPESRPEQEISATTQEVPTD